jgi:hypothetical protein
VPARRIKFRVGFHLGDVIVERDRDLLGDGINSPHGSKPSLRWTRSASPGPSSIRSEARSPRHSPISASGS